jgi:hypothetical protein
MTINSLYGDIDWVHIKNITALHWVRVLAEFIPKLLHLQEDISTALSVRVQLLNTQCGSGRKTTVQPLGTNAERETENHGMLRAVLDFEQQMGLGDKSSRGPLMDPGRWCLIRHCWPHQKVLMSV